MPRVPLGLDLMGAVSGGMAHREKMQAPEAQRERDLFTQGLQERKFEYQQERDRTLFGERQADRMATQEHRDRLFGLQEKQLGLQKEASTRAVEKHAAAIEQNKVQLSQMKMSMERDGAKDALSVSLATGNVDALSPYMEKYYGQGVALKSVDQATGKAVVENADGEHVVDLREFQKTMGWGPKDVKSPEAMEQAKELKTLGLTTGKTGEAKPLPIQLLLKAKREAVSAGDEEAASILDAKIQKEIRVPEGEKASAPTFLPDGTVRKPGKNAHVSNTAAMTLGRLSAGMEQSNEILKGFNPKFTGSLFQSVGDLRTFLDATGWLNDPDQRAVWWNKYRQYVTVVRHDMFGASFTKSEQGRAKQVEVLSNMEPEKALIILQDQFRKDKSRIVRLVRGAALRYEPAEVMELVGAEAFDMAFPTPTTKNGMLAALKKMGENGATDKDKKDFISRAIALQGEKR